MSYVDKNAWNRELFRSSTKSTVPCAGDAATTVMLGTQLNSPGPAPYPPPSLPTTGRALAPVTPTGTGDTGSLAASVSAAQSFVRAGTSATLWPL